MIFSFLQWSQKSLPQSHRCVGQTLSWPWWWVGRGQNCPTEAGRDTLHDPWLWCRRNMGSTRTQSNLPNKKGKISHQGKRRKKIQRCIKYYKTQKTLTIIEVVTFTDASGPLVRTRSQNKRLRLLNNHFSCHDDLCSERQIQLRKLKHAFKRSTL